MWQNVLLFLYKEKNCFGKLDGPKINFSWEETHGEKLKHKKKKETNVVKVKIIRDLDKSSIAKLHDR